MLLFLIISLLNLDATKIPAKIKYEKCFPLENVNKLKKNKKTNKQRIAKNNIKFDTIFCFANVNMCVEDVEDL